MSVVLPGPRGWNAANWVVQSLIESIKNFPRLSGLVRDKVEFAVKAQFPGLNLTNATPDDLRVLREAVQWELERHRRGEVQDAGGYVAKLNELVCLIDGDEVPPPRRSEVPTATRAPMTITVTLGVTASFRGQDILAVVDDGAFEYANRCGDRHSEARGQLTDAAIEAILGGLASANFPVVPEHERPPGPGQLSIQVTVGGDSQVAHLSRFDAEDFQGYKDVLGVAMSVFDALRSKAVPAQHPYIASVTATSPTRT
jgi:hypothetical protein